MSAESSDGPSDGGQPNDGQPRDGQPNDGPATDAPLVDVIVCVHDALDDVRRCLDALARRTDLSRPEVTGRTELTSRPELERSESAARTTPAHRVLVVDDGSGPETRAFLRARRDAGQIALFEHAACCGYTAAANTGLRASSAPYVVLLNSDAVVTDGWLDGLLACARSDPAIGLVGPLSNAASWQSVPAVFGPDGKFAVNALEPGVDPDAMARLVRDVSERTRPRLPILNGFCLLMKRAVIDAVGELDEKSFPSGYGEENDYALRAADAGFAAAVADDVYVHHAKSRSFGHRRRQKLTRAGHAALIAKHGKERVDAAVEALSSSPAMTRVRRRVQVAVREERPLRSVLFLLPVRGGAGGSHSVLQEAAEMRGLGLEVAVAIRKEHRRHYARTYRSAPALLALLRPFDEDREIVSLGRGYDAVVATVHSSVALLERIVRDAPNVVPAYYVQDYEPFFFAEGSPAHAEALASYERIPHCVTFAKTEWLAEIVRRRHGVPVWKVAPSVDHDLYRPDLSRPSSPVIVTAMVRPKTPRRGAARTMRVLARIERRFGSRVRVEVFGCGRRALRRLETGFSFSTRGVLRREGVADQLRRAHVFVDLSDYQAFGRTGIEAMASGCAVVNPVHGGTDEYCVHGENAFLVDTRDEDACVEAIARLIDDADLRRSVASAGLATAARYSSRRAAISEIAALESGASALYREVIGAEPVEAAAAPSAPPARLSHEEIAGLVARSTPKAGWRERVMKRLLSWRG